MATSQTGAGEAAECYPRVINDPIHGFIELPKLCMKIIDTPQFQRLRDIKQLSFCSFVYPGATHSRFEHSLGTCFLAGQQVKHFQKQENPPLGITERDVLCVEIAALCHDLGHGPFSHLWEIFMKSVETEGEKQKWEHEEFSVKMLDFLIQENNLEESFRVAFGDEYSKYKKFIELQISGTAKDRLEYPWKLTGDTEDKNFLYEIVSNKETGLDVDKWDYISRDCHHLGFQHSFNHNRILAFSRVSIGEDDGRKHISLPEKELLNLYSMFNSRFILHSRVYQHNVALAIDRMFLDALNEANNHIKDHGSNNLYEATLDVQILSKMTDSIFQDILYSDKPELESAREILKRIHKRDLYKVVCEFKLTDQSIEEIRKKINDSFPEYCRKFWPEYVGSIVCEKKSVGYGKNGQNPLLNTYFYHKSKPNYASKLKEMSHLLPLSANCNDEYVVVFCRHPSDLKLDCIKEKILKTLETS